MALTANQQAEMDKVKARVDELIVVMQESLNLQAYGGSHVLNELRDIRRDLMKVENA